MIDKQKIQNRAKSQPERSISSNKEHKKRAEIQEKQADLFNTLLKRYLKREKTSLKEFFNRPSFTWWDVFDKIQKEVERRLEIAQKLEQKQTILENSKSIMSKKRGI